MALKRLRDLPGVEDLEWRFEEGPVERDALLLGHDEYGPYTLADMADELARSLFGVDQFDVEDVDDAHFEEVRRLFRDEADEWWARHGWDVTDGKGKQLLVMEFFLEPLICVVKSLHPDAKAFGDADGFASWLEDEAARFKSKRR